MPENKLVGYVCQHTPTSFIWLLVDPVTDQPIGGGTTSSREKAEAAIARAIKRNAPKKPKKLRSKKAAPKEEPVSHGQRVVSRTAHIRGNART